MNSNLDPSIPWQKAGSHPYVIFRDGYDAYGGYYIECHCQMCKDVWGKKCQHPERRDQWIMHYCMQHTHGLQMRRAA